MYQSSKMVRFWDGAVTEINGGGMEAQNSKASCIYNLKKNKAS